MRTEVINKKRIVIIVLALVLAAAGFTIGVMAKSALASDSSGITLEEAKSIALANVGVSAEKATFTRAELDGGQYEIDFHTNSTEYDFEIDAETGAIIEKDYSAYTPEQLAQQQPSASAPSTSTQPQNQPAAQPEKDDDESVIGVAKAKQIALDYVGLSSASFIEASLDTEDGTRVYDIEFTANGTNYDIEIHAYTGKVLSYDHSEAYDYDDDDDDDDDD